MGAVGGGAGAFGGQTEFPGDRLVHVENVAGGEGDVEHAVQAGMEVGGDVAADGGLAAADLTGEQADAAQFEQMFQTRLGFAVSDRREQFVGFEVGGERESGECKVAKIHQWAFLLWSSLRSASGDGGGCGAGQSDSICREGRARLTEALA